MRKVNFIILFLTMIFMLMGCPFPLEPVTYPSGVEGLVFTLKNSRDKNEDVFEGGEDIILNISGDILENDEFNRPVNYEKAELVLEFEKYDDAEDMYRSCPDFQVLDAADFSVQKKNNVLQFFIEKDEFHSLNRQLHFKFPDFGRYYISVYGMSILAGASMPDIDEMRESVFPATISFWVIESPLGND